MVTIHIIWIIVLAIIMYCTGVYIGHNSRDWEFQEMHATISGYRHKYEHARVPLLSKDSSGRPMYTCRRCGKRVYKSLRHCGCCGQRLYWDFILTDDGKVVVNNDAAGENRN